MGVHGFSGKKLGPTWGTVYKYKVKDHKSLPRLKDRSKTCKKLQKGIQEKHSDHKQSKSSTKQFILRVEEDSEDSL